MALAPWICYFEHYMQPCMFRNGLNQIQTFGFMHINGSERLALIYSITGSFSMNSKEWCSPPPLEGCLRVCIPGGVCCLPPLNTISCVFHSLISPVSEKKKYSLKKKGTTKASAHVSLKILLNLWLSLLSNNAESFVFQGLLMWSFW